MKSSEPRGPIGRRTASLNVPRLRRHTAALHHRPDVTDPSSWGPHRSDTSRRPRP